MAIIHNEFKDDDLSELNRLRKDKRSRVGCPTEKSIKESNSNVEATLKIPIDNKSESEIRKLNQAIRCLREAGVYFDIGMGLGFMDWELDWSLKGAYLRVRRVNLLSYFWKRLKIPYYRMRNKVKQWHT